MSTDFLIKASAVPAFQSLPQYGTVAIPFSGLRAPLVGEKPQASGLFIPSAFDALLGTSQGQVENGANALRPRLVLESLENHNVAAWRSWSRYDADGTSRPKFDVASPFRFRNRALLLTGESELEDSWMLGSYPAVSDLSFTRDRAALRVFVDLDASAKTARLRLDENALSTGLRVANDVVTTTDYKIRTDEAGIRDFIVASARHYVGEIPLEMTGFNGDLLLAASLIYQQQFAANPAGTQGQGFERQAQSQALGEDFEAAFTAGYMERVFVPRFDAPDGAAVVIRRMMDRSIEIAIHNPGSGALPLKGNVLMLAARAMMPDRFSSFMDLMAGVSGG